MTARNAAVRGIAASLSAALVPCIALAAGESPSVTATLNQLYPELDALYLDLHRTPELSWHEEKTAAKMAEQLGKIGFEVTTGVGRNGVVGVLKNGAGPTVMLRTELDALPVEEKTGLPYASKVTARNDAGETVSVMHACGHDIHMASWVGAATILARGKDRWRGTVVMIGQPAEEVVSGAAAMLADGLFTRFPKPDYAIAVHSLGVLPAGQIGIVPGYALANMDTVEITIYGKGGHGAIPHLAVDPIVIGARTVLTLQTIVAREVNPLDPAVVTVGSFLGGTKSNIIPADVKLQLTVRSYKNEVQKQLLAAIARIAKAEALAGNAPREPLVVVDPHGTTHSTFNNETLIGRLRPVLAGAFGAANVVDFQRIMASEDFSEYGHAGVPAVLFWIGATEPAKFADLKSKGVVPPNNHSPLFSPDRERTIRTGTTTLALSALELLGNP